MIEENENWNILKCRGWGDKPKSFVQEHTTHWDMKRRKWGHNWIKLDLRGNQIDFFESDNNRENGFFMILQCLDATEYQRGSDVHAHMDIVCDPYIDKYIAVHPQWEPGWVNPVFRDGSYANQFGSNINNPNHNFIFQDEHVVYEGKPSFYINYTNLVDLNKIDENATGAAKYLAQYTVSKELEEWYIKLHPHHCARNLSELFRLIIDWDLAYHHFGNREKVAVVAHNILGTINMPYDLYDEVVAKTPPSVVARYLRGEEDATELGSKPHTPDSLIEWCKEKYWELRHTILDTIPNVGDVDDNHYCHRLLV